MICQGCLKESEKGYCPKCRKELFEGKKVSTELSFNSPYDEDSDAFLDHTKKISISGVQVKYSLRLENNDLKLTERGGQYILKPIPTGTFKYLDQAPANEHLTMQIAKQVFKLSVPPNALIFFKDGSPAYLVRRFDQTESGKIQQEDFAQIAQMTSETHGENYKYDLSYEEIAELIKKYIPTQRIENEKFFRLILFNYVFSNGDAHLKNFSAIQSAQGDYVLTPAYDLLCTRIHSPSESDMALTLFKDGFSKAYESYGFYTYQDFYEFGQLIGIQKSRIKKIIAEFTEPHELVYFLIGRSFLKDQLKTTYTTCYEDKVARLGMMRS
ncbi:HipA domain-containing protein [Fulvivirga lutea]|uniref:HipA domain-containing protein n=1 Tax=Fulvivirga lutea TaxID=2810512 RepID=A0A974WJ52_9BACT|nr:HipA domain-containing protein [Fulvivirga lutea]QSE98167.1 HipA domain-containing protein [Fulvivirga lutea]